MNRKTALALIAFLSVTAGIAILWSMREAPVATGPAVATFDYASASSWAVKPDLPPPAVWETGWDVDVIILSAAAAITISDRVALENRRRGSGEELKDLGAAFDRTGPVYAPYLRAASLDADMAAALSEYLASHNRGRAFLIATDHPIPATLVPAFESDPLLRDRFGGVLFYGESATSTGLAEGVTSAALCSRRYKPEQGCVATVEVRRAGGRYEVSGGEPLTRGLTAWLNTHTSRLAEPLGDLEEIEVIEIRRPGETE